MRDRSLIPGATRTATVSIAVVLAFCSLAKAQKVAPKSQQEGKPATQEQAKADEHKLPAERGDVIDRIVAIVNGDLVLESDVEEEERFTQLYPYGVGEGLTLRDQAVTRLIDRTLIQQQQAGFPSTPVTDQHLDKQITDLRKELPACSHTDCSSDAGWKNFLTKTGFTEEELRDRLRQRTQVLRFIEQRFRNGVRVSDHDIEDFYTKTMLPGYEEQKVTPPPLDSVRDRIEEVLLQRQVSSLLDQWLKTLRDTGHVRMMRNGVETP
jgi:hypothetical protein